MTQKLPDSTKNIDYDPTKFLNDIKHVLKHETANELCKNHVIYCIHYQRTVADRDLNESKTENSNFMCIV